MRKSEGADTITQMGKLISRMPDILIINDGNADNDIYAPIESQSYIQGKELKLEPGLAQADHSQSSYIGDFAEERRGNQNNAGWILERPGQTCQIRADNGGGRGAGLTRPGTSRREH